MQLRAGYGLGQTIGAVGAAIACLAAVVGLQAPQLSQLRNPDPTISIERINRETAAQAVQLDLLEQVPTFGFDNLIANWVFLNFLQYFGDLPAREATDYRLSPEFFDVIVKRDPRFLDAYLFLSASTSIYAAQPERSIALMNQGLQSLTPTTPAGSYFVWRYKAIDELLFLGDADAARRSFETAADWAEASNRPGSQSAALASRQTAQFLATNPDSRSAQVTAWAMVLQSVQDDRTRQTAIARIESLGGRVAFAPDGTLQVQLPEQD